MTKQQTAELKDLATKIANATRLKDASVEVRGVTAVASRAMTYRQLGLLGRPALINGAPGVVYTRDGQLFSVMGFTVTAGRITEIDILADPDRLLQLDVCGLGD